MENICKTSCTTICHPQVYIVCLTGIYGENPKPGTSLWSRRQNCKCHQGSSHTKHGNHQETIANEDRGSLQTFQDDSLQKGYTLKTMVGGAANKLYPELSIKRPEKLVYSRGRMLNPTVVEKYMSTLAGLLTDLEINEKPKNIWNCDETGRCFEHTQWKSSRKKHCRKDVHERINNGVNAAGEAMPPMLVVKGKKTSFATRVQHQAELCGQHKATDGWITKYENDGSVTFLLRTATMNDHNSLSSMHIHHMNHLPFWNKRGKTIYIFCVFSPIPRTF